MRRPSPAAPRPIGYPRLESAWRLLTDGLPSLWIGCAAPLALAGSVELGLVAEARADATVPPPGQAKNPGAGVKGKRPAPVLSPMPEKRVRLSGDIAVVDPPTPPPSPRDGKPAPKEQPTDGGVAPPKAPAPRPTPRPPGRPPRAHGELGRLQLPSARPRGAVVMVLHRHGPDEPCRTPALDDDEG